MENVQSSNTSEWKHRSYATAETIEALKVRFSNLFLQVRFLGYSHTMDDYDQRKLRIFNQINFFQLVAGLLIPILGMLLHTRVPVAMWLVACGPAFVSLAILTLNSFRRYEVSLYAYFILYPLTTCLVYQNGINAGIELTFILVVILSVFFLHDAGFMYFAIGFSMISFFILSVVLKHFTYEIETDAPLIYLLNKMVSLAFIFYGLLLVKKKNTAYQANILSKQKHLTQQNAEIEKQKEELASLNSFKSKLFSIISHDLRSPVYALRNLFQNMQQHNLPAEDVKAVVPDVLKDLNYTTSLMENVLQWAKSQMQADTVNPQALDAAGVVQDVAKLLRLQAEAKNVRINSALVNGVSVMADKDMLHLVLRNLLSNAVKFTPGGGRIEIGLTLHDGFAEFYVQDSGVGISEEALAKIKQKIFYSTAGTASEGGTGLGLMLCHEFLLKNGSRLQIESTVGEGSVFSFALPLAE